MSTLSGPKQIGGTPLFSNTSEQLEKIGTRYEAEDGRVFRYVKAGAADLVAGEIHQAPAEIANHQNLTPAAASAETKSVTVTLGATAATENQYAGGYLVVTSTAGQGYSYKIKGHPAAALSTAVVITLEDPIQVNITASSKIDLVPNPYNGVIQAPASPTGCLVGSAQDIITAAYYGWIQSKGPAVVKPDSGNFAAGQSLALSNATAGCVEVYVAGQPFVGNAMAAATSTDFGMAFLLLD